MYRSVVLVRFNNKAYNIQLWGVWRPMCRDRSHRKTYYYIFFLCKTHMREPSADTNIQNEMIEGGHGGVKMSGTRSYNVKGGFPLPTQPLSAPSP